MILILFTQVLKVVAEKAEAAGKIKASVQVVKDKAQNIVDVIEVDKASAMVKLEAARPALEAAEKALQVNILIQVNYNLLGHYKYLLTALHAHQRKWDMYLLEVLVRISSAFVP